MSESVRPDDGATLLHVAVTYRRAGTEQIMLDILKAAAADGWSTAAVVPPSAPLDAFAHELERAGSDVTRIGPLFESERDVVKNLRDLVRLLRDLRPDVVHLHFPWAPTCFESILACAIARVPAVVRTEHNPIVDSLGTKQVAKLKVLDRLVDTIVCVSSSNRTGHVERAGRDPSQVDVIPNGVPHVRAAPRDRCEVRAELGLSGDTVACVMVGALEKRKGVIDLVRSAALIDGSLDVRFFIVGDGGMRESAERLAHDLGLGRRVRFLGQRDDVQRILPAFDVFVQPSHYEGMSLAMLEALDCGLPMVTTAVDGVDDLFPDGEGAIVCPIGDGPAFAAAVTELATSDRQRRRLGEISQERVRTSFTRAQMTNAYLELYRRLQERPSSRTPLHRRSRRTSRRGGPSRSPSPARGRCRT